MPVNKRKKATRFRGHDSHGRGARKKGRGAGNRGGRGMAGTGKRAAQKKPTILKEYGNTYFGKQGFTRPKKAIKKIKATNVDMLDTFIKGKREIDLSTLGFQKLLGRGKVTQAYTIKVQFCSPKAKEKIEKAGGTVTQ